MEWAAFAQGRAHWLTSSAWADAGP